MLVAIPSSPRARYLLADLSDDRGLRADVDAVGDIVVEWASGVPDASWAASAGAGGATAIGASGVTTAPCCRK
jgi:hypothetical protein